MDIGDRVVVADFRIGLPVDILQVEIASNPNGRVLVCTANVCPSFVQILCILIVVVSGSVY